MLPTIGADDIPARRGEPLDEATLAEARRIVDDVRVRGWHAVVEHAEGLGDASEGEPLVMGKAALQTVFEVLPVADRALLERTAGRIRAFAEAQKKALAEIAVRVPGGRAGHEVVPVERAGCYAPGGRFPL